MGMKPSPFICTRSFAWGLEIIKGDRLSLLNPFRRDRVIVNCPGKVNYDPMMCRLFKWDSATQAIASDCKMYVDDLRTIGASEQVSSLELGRALYLCLYLIKVCMSRS